MTDAATSPTLRWGISSTGGIATKMAAALGTLPDAEIVAVGSRNLDSAKEFADRFDIGAAYGSYDELIADPDVDIVYVASPHNAHRDMTIAALEAGKHVLCEKAFAVNATQAREMVAVAESTGRFLMEAMWSWFIPGLIEIKERVAAGEIGDVRVVQADFGLSITDPEGRHRRADLTGGALLDLGIYPLALARLLLGEPSEIKALGTLTDQGVDAVAGGVCRFDSGAIATWNTTLDGISTLAASVIGTLGRIDIDAPFWFTSGYTVTPYQGESTRVEAPNAGLAHEAQHAMDCIRAGKTQSDVMPLATSIANMELLDEIRSQLGVVYPEER